MSSDNAEDNAERRSKQNRRAEEDRREINEDRAASERRDLNGEGRRSWVGRRQTAEWRKDS